MKGKTEDFSGWTIEDTKYGFKMSNIGQSLHYPSLIVDIYNENVNKNMGNRSKPEIIIRSLSELKFPFLL